MQLRHFDELGQVVAEAIDNEYPDCEVTFISGIQADGQAWAAVLITGANGQGHVQYEIAGVPLLLKGNSACLERELREQVEGFVHAYLSATEMG